MKKGSSTNVNYSSLHCKPLQPNTLLLHWQRLDWREPGAGCAVTVPKHTEQDRGVLYHSLHTEHARMLSGSS